MPNATRIYKKPHTEQHTTTPVSGKTHGHAFVLSLIQFFRYPITNFITILIIAIALALPTGLYVLLKNIRTVSHSWDKGTQISLYLKTNVTNNKAQEILNNLKKNSEIAAVKYISPEEGMAEFQKTSDFGDILSELKQNPLPPVILVEPKLLFNNDAAITNLVKTLKAIPEVANLQLDFEWVKRFSDFINVGSHIASGVFILLSIGLILIISTTISFTTHFALHKITSSKTFSGENSFIYRVFLYKGIWFGLFGSLLTWLLVGIFLWWLREPVTKFAASYGSNFILKNLSWQDGSILLVTGIILGLCGAWLGIVKHSKTNF